MSSIKKSLVQRAALAKGEQDLLNRAQLMDSLEQIFRMQRELNLRIGVDTENMTDADRVQWILNYSRALGQELAELIDSVPWKWWAKYQSFDQQNARVEVVDMVHFLVSIAQALGMDSNQLFEAYKRKFEVNVRRQECGYIEKDESDSRHI